MWTHTCTNTHAHKGDALKFFEHTSDDTTCSTSIKTWWVLIPAHSTGPAPWSFARLNAVLLPRVASSRHIRSQKYRILTIQQAPNWPTISVCASTPHVMSCISSFQFCNPKLLNDRFGNSGMKLLIPQQQLTLLLRTNDVWGSQNRCFGNTPASPSLHLRFNTLLSLCRVVRMSNGSNNQATWLNTELVI